MLEWMVKDVVVVVIARRLSVRATSLARIARIRRSRFVQVHSVNVSAQLVSQLFIYDFMLYGYKYRESFLNYIVTYFQVLVVARLNGVR